MITLVSRPRRDVVAIKSFSFFPEGIIHLLICFFSLGKLIPFLSMVLSSFFSFRVSMEKALMYKQLISVLGVDLQ